MSSGIKGSGVVGSRDGGNTGWWGSRKWLEYRGGRGIGLGTGVVGSKGSGSRGGGIKKVVGF